jgi:hypothetical protein
MAGFCEHDNEPSCSIRKAGFFFDKLSDNQLFKYPAPWSKYVMVETRGGLL